jgi:hypothetical protein
MKRKTSRNKGEGTLLINLFIFDILCKYFLLKLYIEMDTYK